MTDPKRPEPSPLLRAFAAVAVRLAREDMVAEEAARTGPSGPVDDEGAGPSGSAEANDGADPERKL